MKKTSVVAFTILSLVAMGVSCSKNSQGSEPEPEPIETHTVNAYYKFRFSDNSAGDGTDTITKMLDFYKEKGFIESHEGSVKSSIPITLSKTGVAVADTSKVLAALRKELKEKLTNAAKEIKANDWAKTLGVDNFRLGHVIISAITETGEEIDATSVCFIPSLEYGKEYKTGDTTQPLQKFTISDEIYKHPFNRVGKAIIKDKGEVSVVAGLGGHGSVKLVVMESSEKTDTSYTLYFDKPDSGKNMTLKYQTVSEKTDTVSVKYSAQ